MSTFESGSLPAGWGLATIEEIAEIVQYGSSSKTGAATNGIPVLRMGNILGGELVLDNLKYLPADHREFPALLLEPDDILFNRTNSAELVGKTAVYTGEPTPCSFASYLIRLRLLEVNPRLVASYINSPAGRRWIGSCVSQQVGQANVSGKKLKALRVPIPPLNEQRRIVAKLEALQRRTRRARTALDAIPPLLEKFRQSVLASAFRGDLTADWRAQNPDVEPASVLLERIREERRRRWEEAELEKMKAKGKVLSDDRWKGRYKEPPSVDTSALPRLPDEWRWSSVGELSIGDIQTGPFGAQLHRSDFVSKGVPVLAIGNVTWGYVDLDSVDHVTMEKARELSRYLLRAGDVLFTRSGTVGRSAVLPNEADGFLMTGHILRIRLLPSFYQPSLLFRAFRGEPTMKHQLNELTRGATRAGFNTALLSSMIVPVPPVSEQVILIEKLADFDKTIDRFTAFCSLDSRLQALEQAILAKAFRGELVPQDPNDEPAAKLLERIRAAKPETPTRRGRRRARPPKPTPPPATPEPEPEQLSLSLKPSPATEAATHPVDLDDVHLRDRLYHVLLGRGPLDRDNAIREVASALRDDGTVDFRRLRRDGPLYRTLDAAVDAGLASALLDEPAPGEIRAVLRNARDYTLDHWRHALLACLGDEPAEREDAIEAAAIWASENMGLEFQRLRKDGVIVKGLKSAIRSALRRGEVENVGARQIRRLRTD